MDYLTALPPYMRNTKNHKFINLLKNANQGLND